MLGSFRVGCFLPAGVTGIANSEKERGSGLETCNPKLLFDRLNPVLQLRVQVDLSPCPFAGMGYGRFTDCEMVPDRFHGSLFSRRRRLGSWAFIRKAQDPTIHTIWSILSNFDNTMESNSFNMKLIKSRLPGNTDPATSLSGLWYCCPTSG